MPPSLLRPRTEHVPDDVLTLDDAARFLRLSDKTTRELAVAGELPATRLGRQWRFSRRALLAHVERPASGPPSPPAAAAVESRSAKAPGPPSSVAAEVSAEPDSTTPGFPSATYFGEPGCVGGLAAAMDA